MAFPCSGILYLCFESLGLDITSVILNCFKMAATYLLFFLLKNHTNGWFPCDTLLIEIVLPIPTNFTLFCFFIWNLFEFAISISKIYLRSCSNLLTGTNPRSFPLINESRIYARAPSCTIYNPPKLGPGGTEQTMSSQEHLHWYIKKWWMQESTADHVLQVARCFLPHRFKRSFTITFL